MRLLTNTPNTFFNIFESEDMNQRVRNKTKTNKAEK